MTGAPKRKFEHKEVDEEGNEEDRLVFADERTTPYSLNAFLRLNLHFPLPMVEYFGKHNPSKEICEVISAYSTIQAYLYDEMKAVSGTILCVGDGVAPRAGIVLSGRFPNWDVISIDPIMRKSFVQQPGRSNLRCFTARDDQIAYHSVVNPKQSAFIIIVAVHSHGNAGWLLDHLQTILTPHRIVCVAIPCCIKLNLGYRIPLREFRDPDLQTKSGTNSKNLVYLYDTQRDVFGHLLHLLPFVSIVVKIKEMLK